MGCITKGNVRCTKCCEVLHVDKSMIHKMRRGAISIIQQETTFGKGGLWREISARRAKKINPYMFNRPDRDKADRTHIKTKQYYTCKALVKGVGCSIRDEEIHPHTCKDFTAVNDYSPTCTEDSNIIARSV